MHWVNGKLSSSISVMDRSFQYGDGCFTTMLVFEGKIQHWDMHVKRMEECLHFLNIALPNWEKVYKWLMEARLKNRKSGLKLHITRGKGHFGYNSQGIESPNITISHFLVPNHYKRLIRYGLELGVCNQNLGINPLLAGYKHNNRLEQVLLKLEINRLGLFDAIVLDIKKNLIETTIANLFWVKNNIIYTPSLENAGVNGITRQLVIQFSSSKNLKLIIDNFQFQCLDDAEEIFITNSILGVVPVIKIISKHYNIGKVTRYFQERLNPC
ncbi:Aminodeoxychorismate lyase [Candidatus Photodesmus katoptron]|uniref:Aminodeoxychorismate lyase n=1 Tax=Candidatus Photodesmus katoptron Akat1 TaxID=1236703 RepID=S3DGP8_9GAMM|nr:aminodeoxychorismate lyase [Candidatus Photodesmus katoptron]EPE37642.1 aminodeoxychorismate lyase [Candidatus Photodesmus katoptron Akat1]KEY90638.1 Aminodeoxychorismate lyase [Candidatus Photodesmus katoptron]